MEVRLRIGAWPEFGLGVRIAKERSTEISGTKVV